MTTAVGKRPTAAWLSAVAAAGLLPTAPTPPGGTQPVPDISRVQRRIGSRLWGSTAGCKRKASHPSNCPADHRPVAAAARAREAGRPGRNRAGADRACGGRRHGSAVGFSV